MVGNQKKTKQKHTSTKEKMSTPYVKVGARIRNHNLRPERQMY